MLHCKLLHHTPLEPRWAMAYGPAEVGARGVGSLGRDLSKALWPCTRKSVTGAAVGAGVGALVGLFVGVFVGRRVGLFVGRRVGLLVGFFLTGLPFFSDVSGSGRAAAVSPMAAPIIRTAQNTVRQAMRAGRMVAPASSYTPCI